MKHQEKPPIIIKQSLWVLWGCLPRVSSAHKLHLGLHWQLKGAARNAVEFCSRFWAVLSDPANLFQLLGKTQRSCGPGWFPRRAGAVLGSHRWQKSPAVPKGLVYLNSPSVQGQERRSTSARRGQSKHPENLLTSNTLLKRAGGNVAFCQIFPPLFIYQKQWNVYSGSTLTPAHGATGLFCSCLFKQGQLIIFN